MISSIDAKKLILVGTDELEKINICMNESAGFALHTDIISRTDFPDFEQSAMDGYGIFLKNEKKETEYTLIGEEQAGNLEIKNSIREGEAIRIFTGAKIPNGVNTVVQQEWVEKNANKISIGDFPVKEGMNIRPRGSQTKKGELVLKKGSALTPAAVSLLAGLGFGQVEVSRKPNIIIINTGKELVPPGNEIKSGQVYESNSFALNQALAALHIQPVEILWVDDEKDILVKKIGEALSKCDMLLITGGVSVGDYDFVTEALADNDVKQIFHKVKQKPGKPFYYGKKNKINVFGLPGNPASVLTCFYQYVFPSIKKMMGFAQTELLQVYMPCKNNYEKKAGFTHFLKGRIHDEGVEILPHQESYKMNTFAIANSLIEIEEEKTSVEKNELVKVYLL